MLLTYPDDTVEKKDKQDDGVFDSHDSAFNAIVKWAKAHEKKFGKKILSLAPSIICEPAVAKIDIHYTAKAALVLSD